MSASDSSQTHAEEAFKLIKKYNIPAVPEFYEVIYDHVSDKSPEVSSKIKEHLKKNLKLDMCFINELRETHYKSDCFEELGDILNTQISSLTKNVNNSLSSVNSYNTQLRTSNTEIKNAKSTGDIVKTMQNIVKENQLMLERTSSMEKNLQASKKQAMQLNSKLNETKKLAYTDVLTGIPNRLQLLNFLSKELKLANSEKSPLCLIIGDVDHFKKFNDTYGHLIGDQVLRYVGFSLKNIVKNRELCARYGGEEFAIVLPQTGLENATKKAEAICRLIRKRELKRKSTNENLGSITISLGVALYRHGEIADNLISRADECLYLAKEAGRNRAKSEIELLDKTG